MAIYQLFEDQKKEGFTETFDQVDPHQMKKNKVGPFFSTLVTRFCFFLLLVADLLWFVFNTILFLTAVLFFSLTCGRVPFLKKLMFKFGLSFRRSVVCALSLFVGLFSPPFGIMVACTYFLMYDKAGMEEVVPAPLQAQFKDIFNTER